ncbi:hypothetical protein [Shewanella denitrificans]|uniref:hypothetical protein n=1 Tax=Shewanella denitrificans TaxID=192073 RepID=UPI0012F8C780
MLKHIVNFEDLIIKVKGIRLSDVGYERLISVLDKTTSVKDIRIHKAEDITSVFDSIKGVRRVKLFLFNGDNPMMKVEIVITSPKNYDVEHATLVIN